MARGKGGGAVERVILHCDMNSFYASVELLSHPELRDAPVAVCGDPTSRRGIVLAKNEAAKKFGVVTAETIWQARKKCPGLVLLPPHHHLYREYSERVNAIYEEYTDLVEPFSVDESWLDVTGSLHLLGRDGRAVADGIRARVEKELGLTVSVGVSFNKVFAKLGSDYKKPNATTVISPQNWKDFVWPLPVGSLLFVGKTAQATLAQFGVRTIGQLAAMNVSQLETLMGKMGRQLHEYANGQEHEPVRPRSELEPPKSVGSGSTFQRDLSSRREVGAALALLSDEVAMRLRRCGMYAGGVAVTLRTPDFQDRSRQKRFSSPTHLMRELADGAMELLDTFWKPPAPIRMLTVTAIALTEEADAYEQTDLLDTAAPRREKQEKLESAMDKIRGKYGMGAVRFGASGPEKKEDTLS